MISHEPPYGILDQSFMSKKKPHVGSTALHQSVERFEKHKKPQLWIFGHIHEGVLLAFGNLLFFFFSFFLIFFLSFFRLLHSYVHYFSPYFYFSPIIHLHMSCCLSCGLSCKGFGAQQVTFATTMASSKQQHFQKRHNRNAESSTPPAVLSDKAINGSRTRMTLCVNAANANGGPAHSIDNMPVIIDVRTIAASC